LPHVWAAFGASLTQGTQSYGVNPHSQLLGVSAQVARQAGVYLGLPLLTEAVLPGIQLADVSADCTVRVTQGDLVHTLTEAVRDPDDLLPDPITPLSAVAPLIVETMDRLGRLHGQYFIANAPPLSFAPNVAHLRQKRLADGLDTAESFDAKLATIDARADAYN